MKKIILRIILALSLLLLLVLIIIGAGLAWIQTESGQKHLESVLNRILVWEEGHAEISGLSGRIPFDIHVEEISVHDLNGSWLEITEARLHWSFRELLQRNLHVFELGAAALDLHRLPRTDPEVEEEREIPEEFTWEWPLPPLNVERLYLKRAGIDEQVFGEKAEFRLEGHFLARQHGFTRAALELERLDRTETRLHLAAELGHDAQYLDIDLSFFDSVTLPVWFPENNLPQAIEVSLSGRGALDDWPGRLSIKGEDIFGAELAVNLRTFEDKLFLHTLGDLHAAPEIAPDPLGSYLEHPFFLDASLNFDLEFTRLHLENIELNSPELDLDAEARLNLEEMHVQGLARLELTDINPLIGPADFISYDPALLYADFHGPLNSLTVAAEILLGRLYGYDFYLSQLGIEAEVELLNTDDKIVSARGRAKPRGLNYPMYPRLPEDLELDFDLDYSRPAVLNLHDLKVTSHDLEVLVSGVMDLESMQFASDLHARTAALEKFLPPDIINLGLEGELDLQAEAAGNLQDDHYDLQALISGRTLSVDDELLNALMSREPRIDVDLSFGPQQELTVRQFNLQTVELELFASGLIHLQQRSLDVQAWAEVPDLGFLSQILEQEMVGALSAQARASGAFDGLNLTLHSDLSGFKPDQDIPEMDIRAIVDSFYTPELFAGNAELNLSSQQGVLNAQTEFALHENMLVLSSITASGLDTSLDGQADLDLETFLIAGRLDLFISEVHDIAALAGAEAYGQVEAAVFLESREGKQDMLLELETLDLIVENLAVSRLNLESRFLDMYSDPYMESSLDLAGMDAGPVYASSFKTRLIGSMQELNIYSEFDGQAWQPLQLSTEITYAHSDDEHEITLHSLRGRYALDDFLLQEPATLIHSERETILSQVNLSYGLGLLRARGHLAPEEVQFHAVLEDLQLSQIPLPAFEIIEGRMGAEMDIEGPVDSPRAAGWIAVEDVRPRLANQEDFPGIDLWIRAGLVENELDLEVLLQEARAQLLLLELVTPARFSLDPAVFELPEPKPMHGSLTSSLDLATIASIIFPPDQTLTGQLTADLDISGYLDHPVLNGTIELEDGIFEHITAGVYITGINALIRAQDEQLILEEFRASDGENGRIRGQGWLDLDLEANLPWNFDLEIQQARILRHQLAIVDMESGILSIQGDSGQADVVGRLDFSRIEAELPRTAPPGVVHLEVTEINVPEEDLPPAPSPVDLADYPIHLDIELNFPARVFVRGRGLDSEWGGHLHVVGLAHEPSVRGELNVIRGRLTFLDRRFDLDTDSFIFLDGSHPPDPILELTAHLRHRDRDVAIRVFGPASSPQLDLDSDPPMHEDEILAWVLFGRDLGGLTPFQAITLINAIRTLALDEPGPDLLGQMRSFIGVDDIDIIRDPEEGHTQFGLGRYVHERVYVQFRKGTAPGTDEVIVQIELTPRLMLEGNVESDAEGEVFIFWKRDY